MTDWKARLGIIGYSSLSIAVLLLHTTERSGYHAFFYDTYPLVFWFFLLVALISGLLLIIYAARKSTTTGDPTNAWVYGFVLVFVTYAVFFALPRLSGLPFWAPPRADVIAHFADVRSILSQGHIVDNDVYPAIHIWVAEIAVVTGLPMEAFQWLIGYTYTGIFILGCAIYARQLFDTRGAGLFTLAVGSILLYGKYNHHQVPWLASFALIPLTLFVVDRHYRGNTVIKDTNLRTERYELASDTPAKMRRSIQTDQRYWYALCYLIFTVSIALYHPMTALVLFSILITLSGATYLSRWRLETATPAYRSTWVLVVPVIHVVWYVFTLGLDRLIAIIVGGLVSGSLGAASRANAAGSSGYTPMQLLVRFVIGDFGVLLIVAGLGGFIALVAAYRYYRRNTPPGEVLVMSLYITGIALAALLLAAPLVTSGPYRINQVTLFASVLLIGYALSIVFKAEGRDEMGLGPRTRLVARGVLCLSVVAAAVGAVGLVYDEPNHVTESEFDGTEWFLTHYDTDFATKSRIPSPKIAQYILGQQQWSERDYSNRPFLEDAPDNELPRRLGYPGNESIAATLREAENSRETYLITRLRDVRWWHRQPPNRRPYVNYYTSGDVRRLGQDSAANKLYSNGNFAVWLASN